MKPTIAMIRGYCIGGGLATALNCDIRIAAEGSRFGIPAAKLGLGYAYEGINKLVGVVGPAYAREIFYTARQFTAEEALQMGLINRLVPADELEGYVKNYCDTIAANAPLTIRAAKQITREVLKDELQRDMALCQRVVDRVLRQRGLHRRPHRLHGKAPPGVQGPVSKQAPTLPRFARAPPSPASRGGFLPIALSPPPPLAGEGRGGGILGKGRAK